MTRIFDTERQPEADGHEGDEVRECVDGATIAFAHNHAHDADLQEQRDLSADKEEGGEYRRCNGDGVCGARNPRIVLTEVGVGFREGACKVEA